MKRLLLVLVLALMPAVGSAQQKEPQASQQAVQVPSAEAQLHDAFDKIKGNVEFLDKLVAYLKDTASKNPDDAAKTVEQTARNLSVLADRLASDGDVGKELLAIRTAAGLHMKRVQEMPPGTITEEDRTKIVGAWEHVLQQTDTATGAMSDLRTRLMDVLNQLRMKETAMSELLLAGQYGAAIQAFMQWVAELQVTVTNLHKVIDTFGSTPTS